MKKLFSLLTLALLTLSVGAATTVTDVITADQLTATGTSYTDFSNVSVSSSAVYAGQSAKSSAGAIQLRSKNSNSGIVSTTSGGKLVSVKINVESGSNTIDVYGNTTAYTSATNLYATGNANQGTKIGSTSTTGTIEVLPGDEYQYVGIRSNNGAVYISSIEITWEVEDSQSTLAKPVFNPAGGEFTGSLEVTVSCATENASIYLFKVLEDETEEYVNQFFPQNGVVSGTFYVTDSGKYGAYSYKGNDMSDTTYATFTKKNPVVATPVFTPAGATFEEDINVKIECATEGATIMYQVNNGDVEMGDSPVYVTLTETSTITAFASLDGYDDSQEVSATYTKVAPATGTCITFNSANDKGNGTQETTPWTIEKNGVTMSCTSGRVYDAGYRIYKDSTLTFTSTVGNITRIEFDGISGYAISNFGNVEGMIYTGNNGLWIGNAQTITFTAGAQIRASEIRVYVDGEVVESIAAPTLPASCEFEDSKTIEIINNDAEATLMYALNDGEFVEYTEALTLTETTKVSAKAVKGERESSVVSATYTKVEPAEAIATLAEVNALGKNAEFTFEGNAVVTVQRGAYLWLRDASGYGLIYGNINGLNNVTFAPGTVLNQGWTAKTSIFNGLMEYTEAQNVSASENTDTVLAAIQTITELDTTMVNAYVQVLNVKSLVANGKDVTATLANGTTMVMYNSFGESLPTEEGNYTVKGVVSTHNGMQLMILSVEGFVPQTNDVYSIPEAIAVGENDTFTMYDDIVVTFNHASTKRMWIRDTDGNSGLIYGLENTDDIVNGTVLSDGWTGKNNTRYGVPQFQNTEGVAASGETAEAKPFEVPAITASDVNAYVIFKGINMLSDASNEKRFYNAADSTVLYNTFNMTLPEIVEGNTYDVTGVVTLFNGAPQLYITEVVESINDVIKGDANNDTVVNVSDAIALLNALLTSDLSTINTANADVDENGTISITDVIKLVNYLSNGQWQ